MFITHFSRPILMLPLFIWMLLLVMQVESENGCPEDFISFTSSDGLIECFKLVRDKMTFFGAKSHCEKSYGGHLASIKNTEEHEFIFDKFFRNRPFDQFVWLGAQRDPLGE